MADEDEEEEEKPEEVEEPAEEPVIVDVEADEEEETPESDPQVVIIPVTSDGEKEEDAEEEEAPEDADEPVIVPLVVVNEEAESAPVEEEKEDTVSIATPDVADDDTVVVPIVISDDDDDTADEDEAPITDDDSDEAGEDTKVFSISTGNRVYVTYDYSFQSKLAQSSADVQSRYALISDTLLSYGLKLRESWKKERYFAKSKTYANMIFRGKTLCVCLAIKPESLENTKYFFENVGNVKKYESVPVLVRIRSGRGCKYALELIKMMLEGAGIAQKRPVSDHFTVRPALTKEELVEKGYIKVMMTDGEGHPIPADFEAMKNNKFFSQNAGMPILKKVSVEEAAAIPDEEVKNFIDTEEEKEVDVKGTKKGIINIDTISENYRSGDTVTLQSLIAKKLVAKNIGSLKVLARGTLDKALTVKAHDFSMDAAKMIVIAGGIVIKLKTQK